jgi:DNA-binding MarR family transcriptional regulator
MRNLLPIVPGRARDAVTFDVFGQVFVLAQQLARRADAELAPLGLTTSQWLLLAVVTRHPRRPPSLSEAAAVYGTSRQNVKQVAGQLAARGYLELRADPGDARALRLHATAKVAEAFDRAPARARQRRFIRRLFTGLSDGDVGALGALLDRWLEALSGGQEQV